MTFHSEAAAPAGWTEILRAGLRLGLTPEAVWRLSVREWRMLSGAGEQAMTRTRFEALAARFPDGKDEK